MLWSNYLAAKNRLEVALVIYQDSDDPIISRFQSNPPARSFESVLRDPAQIVVEIYAEAQLR